MAANLKLLRVPDLVIGFKVKDPKKADAQVKRLEDLLTAFAGFAPPPVRDGFKRVKVGKSSVLNLTLDGSLVPWDELHIKDYEEKEGEFDALLKKLSSLKLSVSLGVHGNHFVIAIGESPEALSAIGAAGKRLFDLPEFNPLRKYADKRITSIGYASKALLAASQPSAGDFDELAKMGKELLPLAELPDEQVKKLTKDIDTLVSQFKKGLAEPGAVLDFSFLTARGTESYAYDYTKKNSSGLDASKPLTLASFVGGKPIFFAVGRAKAGDVELQRAGIEQLKTMYGHVEEALFTKLNDEQKEQYQKVVKLVFPILKRLDEVTTNLLAPALADSQFGFVFDGKWTSKHWQTEMPATDKALPMPEFGFLLGVSDADKFAKAMAAYRGIINDALAAASELGMGQIPDLVMPAPKVDVGATGRLAYYPIPAESGLDPKVVPTAGLAAKVAILTLSREHTERLLKATPVTFETGPLANFGSRPLAGASALDWPAFVNLVTPWIEYGVKAANPPPFPPGPEGDVLKQVRVVLQVLKVFHGSTSASYYEDGVSVTHSESALADLP